MLSKLRFLPKTGLFSKESELPRVDPDRFRFARISEDPERAVIQRLGLAILLLLALALITYIGRAGYSDSAGGDSPLTFVDALYYATVTITTTGYGDIVPVTQEARLIATLLVTPIRILFLVLLVGTTLQIVANRRQFRYRFKNWKDEMKDHVVVCGFGVKGRKAIEYMRKHDSTRPAVAIDSSAEALEAANKMDVTGIRGNAFDTDYLEAAQVRSAGKVIVALSTDELSILTVLRVREMNKKVTIVAACREEDNVEILENSGADEVIVSASSAGRLLGMAAQSPAAAEVVNELITFGDGLDINQREVVTKGEELVRDSAETAIAVMRNGEVIRLNQEPDLKLEIGDMVIYIDQEAPSEIDDDPDS